jgi:hypothetical protein
MKNRLLPFVACAALMLATPAIAFVAADRAEPELNPTPTAPPVGTCAPAGFTIFKTGEGYVLKGVLETPSPNYKYGFDNGILTLVAPEGAQLAVIDSIAIQLALPETAAAGVSIPVKKPFNWGPDNITCELSSGEKSPE